MRFLVVILLLIGCRSLFAGDTLVLNKLGWIDSLIFRESEYDEAFARADELLNDLDKRSAGRENMDYTQKALLLKSTVLAMKPDYVQSLQLLYRVLDESERYNLPENAFNAHLQIALISDHVNELADARKHLDAAYKICKTNNLDPFYSTYCVRMSSHFRFLKQRDSAVRYAYEAIEYSRKFEKRKDFMDACFLLGGNLPYDRYKEAIHYYKLSADNFLSVNDRDGAVSMLLSISKKFLLHNEPDSAFYYNDLSMTILPPKDTLNFNPLIYKIRYSIFEQVDRFDSAFYYLKLYQDLTIKDHEEDKRAELKRITEQYENDKKEAVIKTQYIWLLLIISLSFVVAIAALLLWRKNKKIHSQNTIINQQVEFLKKILVQKEFLLSELQHRVKNNLQHVASILEMQKESVHSTNIDELIRENQNRIYSMSLLHNKLTSANDLNEVDLGEYIVSLAELVVDSYGSYNKNIQLEVRSGIERIGIDKALPIGMILVELISNSIKHAFKGRKKGKIGFDIVKDEESHYHAVYTDDGIGFDFEPGDGKGLGVEIVKGFVDQLNGGYEVVEGKGFKLKFYF